LVEKECILMRELDRFQGCLLGGAVGDALGYPVEFLSADEILRRYGRPGIGGYGAGEISDDTQMTLFTAAGLLTGAARGTDLLDAIREGCLDWYRTQTEAFPLGPGRGSTWLVQVPELFRRRAPGSTCLSALARGGRGTPETPVNGSKGCGGVMRVAPIALWFAGRGQKEEAALLGAQAAALTHGHELGYLPAAMLVHILVALLEGGTSLRQATEEAMAAVPVLFPRAHHMGELLALMERAAALSRTATDDLAAIQALGEGWVAEETLAIALYCALKYEGDFEKGITAAVNHGGDSDSTGAVAGNLLGAALGRRAIPGKYLEGLELSDLVLTMAGDLYAGVPIEPEGIWRRKYVDGTYGAEE